MESDEATYSLHAMLRFDLERSMLRGDLSPADLPGAWNERVRADLGTRGPQRRAGLPARHPLVDGLDRIFSDLHVGFALRRPVLGSVVPGRRWRRGLLLSGNFRPVLAWLREKIHAHGRCYPAAELCTSLTGAPLSHAPLCVTCEPSWTRSIASTDRKTTP